ncbi:hypothetical protein AVEN_165794-1 [Araneus ventricosus]|uniref:Uncharacterized protein n=1 Tax=Araneus ventricosus TaxID=182803 RepID=A0A4Y2EDF3_ARAVE|nr:hypothetical protein AVEN_165794-1 [Araneus ventricosus]
MSRLRRVTPSTLLKADVGPWWLVRRHIYYHKTAGPSLGFMEGMPCRVVGASKIVDVQTFPCCSTHTALPVESGLQNEEGEKNPPIST